MRDFVKFDSSEALENAIEAFEKESGEELYAGDERRMMINSFMYLAEIIMAEINYRANNNLIAYCDEETLLLKGAERNVQRIEAKKASVMMSFTSVSGEAITIPKGTRVTADGKSFFETVQDAVMNTTELELLCEAVEPGEEYNGFEVGKINILADTIPYITKVTNTTESQGGGDLEDIESYRKRVIDAPKGFSTAGADLAYMEKVKEVDENIADVRPIYDEEESVLNIYVLCKEGKLPDSDLILKIKDHIYQKNIKASTDKVEILAAVQKKYSINCSFKIDKSDEEKASEIKENVEKAVEDYIKTMNSAMGIAINPEILKKYMYNAGAATANVSYPIYAPTDEFEVATCTEKTVTYDGVL